MVLSKILLHQSVYIRVSIALTLLTLNQYTVRSASGIYHSNYLGMYLDAPRQTCICAEVDIRFDDRDKTRLLTDRSKPC